MNDTGSTDPTSADPEERPTSARAIVRNALGAVRLVPGLPPGRCTRKALPFADEIHRLYATGYTLEAIRQALSAAGVNVSRSTVHREVTRASRHPSATLAADTSRRELDLSSQAAVVEPAAQPKRDGAPVSPGRSPSPDQPGQSSFANGPRGEDVAKAFMSTQITNPFLRHKEPR